jgi:hypothetical protein
MSELQKNRTISASVRSFAQQSVSNGAKWLSSGQGYPEGAISKGTDAGNSSWGINDFSDPFRWLFYWPNSTARIAHHSTLDTYLVGVLCSRARGKVTGKPVRVRRGAATVNGKCLS